MDSELERFVWSKSSPWKSLYSAVTNQANFLDLQRGSYTIPVSYLEEPILYDFLCFLLKTVEEEENLLSKISILC